MTDYTAQITALYEAIEFQAPSSSVLASFNAQLNNGAITLAGIQALIEIDSYTIGYVAPLIREYQAAFGRVPDQAGLKYWVDVIAANPSQLSALATIFANSAEFGATYGANATTAANLALVGALYSNVLGRPGDQAGITYWSNSGLTAAQLLTAFAQSQEFINDTAAAVTAYENLEAAGTPATTGSLFALAPPPGATFALTTGADKFGPTQFGQTNNNTVGGTFNGAGATLTTGDNVNGGTTTGNTMELVDLGAGGAFDPTKLGGITVADMQTLAIVSGEAINASTATSTMGFSGLTLLKVTESNNAATSTIVAGSTTNINVNDQGLGAGKLYVEGGQNVYVAVNEVVSNGGGIYVGDATAPSGQITVVATDSPPAADFVMDPIYVYGGNNTANISVTETLVAGSSNSTTTGGVVNVYGSYATTSVSVVQTSPPSGYGDPGQVNITDYYYSGGFASGAITTILLDGLNANSFIYDSALANLTLNNAHANLTIDEGSYATPASVLNLSETSSSVTLIDKHNKYTTLNVSANGFDQLSVQDTALTTVKVTAADSSSVFYYKDVAGALKLFDASGDPGIVVLFDASANAVVKGATGESAVELDTALTSASGGSIALGPDNTTSNSLFGNLLLAGPGGSIGAGVSVDGGGGAANVISASLVTPANASGIKDFQVLELSGYGAGAGNGPFDASLLSSPVTGLIVGLALGASGAPTNGVATINNLAPAVTILDAADSGPSSFVLTHKGGVGTLAISVLTSGTTIASLVSTGDTSISIHDGGYSGASASLLQKLAETDNHLTSISITAASAFGLGNVLTNTAATSGTTGSSLTTIDGSASTGALNISAGADSNVAGGTTTYAGLTILGGSGGDTIYNYANNGVITEGATAAGLVNDLEAYGSGSTVNDQKSAGVDVIGLHSVNQTANLGSGGTVPTPTTVFISDAGGPQTVVDTVNFGSGIAKVTDNLSYGAAAGANTSNANGNILVLGGALHGEILAFAAIANAAGPLGAAVSVSGASNFDQAVHYGEAATINTVTWFQYGGNTYIENSGLTAGSAITAEVVKITGLIDLSHATGAATGVTFA
jgi:S-layer protein